MKRVLAVAALSCVACNAGPDDPGVMYMPEMVVSTPYDAHDRNPVLPGRMTLQPPAEGAIPRGYQPFHYGPGPEQATAADAIVSPRTAGAGELARGRYVYETFCAVCHGRGGDGDGTIVPPFPNPPSLKSDRAHAMTDGRIYHIITRGQGLMPSYAAQVHEDDRWRAVLYVRSLQGRAPEGEGDPPAEEAAAFAPDPLTSDAGAPATDVPATDVPATDVPATDVPATDTPVTEAAPTAPARVGPVRVRPPRAAPEARTEPGEEPEPAAPGTAGGSHGE